jgi:RNA polymerase-binding transcription factor DksA
MARRPLTSEEVRQRERVLRQRFAELSERIEGLESAALGEQRALEHQADQGVETRDQELDLDLLGSEEASLERVRAALDRIEAGTYGSCEACGQPIAAQRLEALPEADLCMPCAARSDG